MNPPSAARQGEALQIAGGLHLPAQEPRQVARNRRILRVRQPHAGQRGARTGCRARVDADHGEESFDQGAGDLGAGKFGPDRLADQARSAARHDHGKSVRLPVGHERLLGGAAAVGQRLQLPCVQVFALPGELGLQDVSQGEVHVVSAEQDVVPDRDAAQLDGAVALGDGDQGKIRRAATHVDDEHDVARLHL